MSINELAEVPTDAISSVQWSPDGGTLLVGAWDSHIYIYTKTPGDGQLQLTYKFEHYGAVLDIAWHADSSTFFVVGLAHEVVKYELAKGSESGQILSTHSQPSNKVAYSAEHEMVLSVSWDSTMHVHDPASMRYVPIQLAAKPLALSLTPTYAVVAMTARKVHVFDLAALKMTMEQAGDTSAEQQPIGVQPWQQRESSLKFMTRDLACMPDGTGFASSSIEGRVGVEWFDEELNKQTYAFKCHREKTTASALNETGETETQPVDVIYPVNAIAFHPTYGTFATGGGDGVVALWDAKTKRRIRQYPKLPASVAQLDFSPDGRSLAIAISPGFEDGKEQDVPDPTLIQVLIRELGDTEAKGKASKEKAPKDEQ